MAVLDFMRFVVGMGRGKLIPILILAAPMTWGQVLDDYKVDAGADQVLIWTDNSTMLRGNYDPRGGISATVVAKGWMADGLNAAQVKFNRTDHETTQVEFDAPGNYTLILTVEWQPAIGPNVTVQDTCLVSVNQAPFLTQQPENALVTAPAGAAFSAAGGGFPTPGIQWQRFSGATWSNIPGATSGTYALASTSPSDNGARFRARLVNSAGEAFSDEATLSVQYAPQISGQPANATVTSPDAAVFSVTASGNPATLSYQWYRGNSAISGATGASYTLSPTAPGDNGAVFSVEVSNAAGTTASGSATLAVQYKPRITSHPQSLTVTAPDPASFSVTANGNPASLSYQWTRDGSPIPGATASTYSLNPTSRSDNGSVFRVVVSNSAGDSVSLPATLTVNAAAEPPTFTSHPVNQTVTAPAGASFSAAATGNPAPTLQWQRNLSGVWTNIPGATTGTYSLASTAPGDNGAQFRLAATNAHGTAFSNGATLTVHYAPTVTTPANLTVTAPASAAFSVTATGNPAPAYQWQRNNGSAWANISGANGASYSLSSTAPADHGARFRCVVTNSAGSATSGAATLTVQYAAAISVQPLPQTVLDGATATFSVTATGNPAPTYQWRRGGGGNPINGATQSSYTTNSVSMSDSGTQYSVTVSNGIGEPVTSNVVRLHVNRRPPVITTEPSPVTVNEGQTATFTLVSSGTLPLSYQWRKNNVNIAGATAASYTTPATVPADSGSIFRCIVSNPAGADTSAGALLRVNRVIIAPVVTNSNLTVAGTVGAAFTYTITATGTQPLTYSASPLPAGLALNASTGVISGAPSSTGATSTLLRATNAAGTSPARTLSITIHPAPVAPLINSPLADTGRAGQAYSYTITASGTQPMTFGASGLPAGLSVNASTGAISGTPTVQGSFQIGLSASNSAGQDGKTLVLNLQPAFASPRFTVNLPESLVVEENQSATFTVAATGVPTPSVQWQYRATSTAAWSAVGSHPTTYVIQTVRPASAGQYRAVAHNTILPNAGSVICQLVVRPAPVRPAITTQPSSLTVLVGAAASFTVQATGTAPLAYQWQKNGANISGATSATLTRANVQLADSGRYRVLVSNVAGTDTSAYATLTVNLPKLAMPAITPAAPDFYPQVTVTLTADSGASIRYTLNGNDPTASSTLYAAPFNLQATTRVRARAFRSGFLASDVLVKDYTLTPPDKAARPMATPADTQFTGSVSVSLSTSTTGADIHYTLNGAAPSPSSPKYSTPLVLLQTTRIRAVTLRSGLLPSDTLDVTYRLVQAPSKAARPTADPHGGRFRQSLNIQLATTTDSAEIWYTTDSTSPATSSSRQRYRAGELILNTSAVLQAVAVRPNWQNSDIMSETYEKAPGPLRSEPPIDMSFEDSLYVMLTVPSEFPIYYTLDGTTPIDAAFKPTAQALRYGFGITLKNSATLVAVALDGAIPSDTLVRFFSKLGAELPPPAASPAGRLFKDTLVVTLKSSDSSVTIRYTLDGLPPNQASPVYLKPLILDTTTHLQAVAEKAGHKSSPLMSENYVLDPDTPYATPRGGRFFGPVNVTLASRSRRASLYYTLDGTAPAPATAIPYTGPIRIDQPALLQAIAVAGNRSSAVRQESYLISSRADTLLGPGQNYQPGGGYVLRHVGQISQPARIAFAPPDTLKVRGFSDIPFAMILRPEDEEDPFPRLVFTMPPDDPRSVYLLGADGRPLFISDADSTAITQPGVYFIGVDVEAPTVRFLDESFKGDSTQARFVLDDNVANLLYSLQRSDQPGLNISQQPRITPDTAVATLKNKDGILAPLWVVVVAADGRNVRRFPAGTDRWSLGQKLTQARSPDVLHLGENPKYPWDLVSFPLMPQGRITFGEVASTSGISSFGAAAFRTRDNSHVFLGTGDSIASGRAYWIRSGRTQRSLALPPVQLKPPPGGRVRIRLDSGWNLVGNPYPQTLYWPHPRKAQSYAASKIKAPWGFDFRETDYRPSDSLEPWRGYFVYSYVKDSVVELSSRPVQNGSKIATAASAFGGFSLEIRYGTRMPLELGGRFGAKAGFGLEDELELPSIADRAALSSWRDGRRLRADYLPYHPDSLSLWTVLVRNPDPEARELLKPEALSLPAGFEAWVVSPARRLRHPLRDDMPAFLPAPGRDSLLVAVGSRTALARSGLFAGISEGLPGFGLRLLPRGRDFRLELILPSQSRVEARLLDLRGKTVAALSSRWLGAGHHAFSLAEHFRIDGRPGRGVYILWLRHQGEGLPARTVRRIPLGE